MTLDQAHSAYHQGRCDDDVQALSDEADIRAQLDALDVETVKRELREYGAWDDDELSDHAQNLQRLLWLAAGDIHDSPETYQ
jgi:hypothetical protein